MTPTLRHRPSDDGMSIYAGALGVDGAPVGCRAVGLTSKEDLSKITVYVPMATSRDLIAGVAATKRLAVVATHPPDHWAIQLKGTTTAVRLATDAEAPIVRAYVEGFAQVLHAIGYPLRVPRSVNHWPAFALEMNVEDVFEQTPGPKAGEPIR